MTFIEKFKDDDFLEQTDEIPRTTANIALRVGCSHQLAVNRLRKLQSEGKVKKIEIEGGRDECWVLVATDVNSETEPKYEPNLYELVSEYSRNHPDDALAKEVYDIINERLHPYSHAYKEGDYVVLLDPEVKQDLKKSTGYAGEIVMLVTRRMQTMVWLEAVSDVVKYANGITTATPDRLRLATQEEIDAATSYVIPEKYLNKMQKAAESDG